MGFRLHTIVLIVLGTMVGVAQEIPRNGVLLPRVIRSVKAAYTPEAKAARIEGTVLVDVLVLSDGSVGDDGKVVRSLDTKFGLDEQAVNASKQWRFRPGMKDGKPTAMQVTIEQSFKLNSK